MKIKKYGPASLIIAAMVLALVSLMGVPVSHSQNTNAPAPAWYNVTTGLINFLVGGSTPVTQTVAASLGDPYVTTNFSCAVSPACTALLPITGLSWTLPPNVATNSSFACHILTAQATGAAANSFGIVDSVAPTNLAAVGYYHTSTTVTTEGNLPTLTTSTDTAIVTATPSAATTIFAVDLYGFIQEPASTTAPVVQISVLTGSSSDVITVEQGSYCQVMK
jgi:hypothetical protein